MSRVVRRRLVQAGAAVLFSLPALPAFRALRAQPVVSRLPLIGYLSAGNPEPSYSLFKKSLGDLGYVDGTNVRIELRSAQGRLDQLPALAGELVALDAKVLVTVLTPAALAARRVAGTTPIVMAGVADPQGGGLIDSLSRPGGNVTGVAGMPGQVASKTLEVIRDALPMARRVTVLVNSADPYGKSFLAGLQDGGARMGMQITPVVIGSVGELEPSFEQMLAQRPDAVVVQPSLPLGTVAQLALRHRLAAFSSVANFTQEGGLMAYAADLRAVQEAAAGYVDRILKGAKPGDLPVQQADRYVMSINLGTAKALGLTIPKTLMIRADQLID